MISVVIPVFNEEELIDNLYARTLDSLKSITDDFEIICVDDGSSDSSLAKLIKCHEQDKRFKVLSLSRNFGHQAALLAGLSFAKGDCIAMIDGDLQDPPELLAEFYKKIEEGYQVVYAIRKKRKEGLIKRIAYWLFYRIMGSISKVRIAFDSGDFSMITREVLDQMLKVPEQSLFLRGSRSWVGFKQTGIEYEREKRAGGSPKYNFKMLFNLAYNGIFSFSDFPIKFLWKLGFVTALLSAIYILVIFIKKIFFGTVPEGFTTLILAIIFFSGVQLICIGILGEYIVRIYDETRKKPHFIVKEKYLD
jgi:glycosyltransferase involved in cell wall biosynthesis